MKTILVVTDNLQDQINGVVTTFKNLENHAHDSGYDIVYINPGQFPNFACPGYPEVRLSWPHGISKKIKEIDPDYIHQAIKLGIAKINVATAIRQPYERTLPQGIPAAQDAVYRTMVELLRHELQIENSVNILFKQTHEVK